MREVAKPIAKLPIDIDKARRQIMEAKRPQEARPIELELERAENLMRESGLFSRDQIRVVNETRMWAVWKLGRLLAAIERKQTPGTGRGHKGEKSMSRTGTSFRDFLAALDPPLDKNRAQERQRIGAMPEKEAEKALAAVHKDGDLATIGGLLREARPFWYKASRQRRHRAIVDAAVAIEAGDLGRFPLIYADPPWKFEIYSEKGSDRTPDQHYPTLTDDEIVDFEVAGKSVRELWHDDAALFLWCTSSNIHRALRIMDDWGFTFKSSAAWIKWKDDKLQTGLGLVFRNAHELLLYGTRGKMPGPQYQPPSVFLYPRERHSEKPVGVREEIEKMYPDFGAKTRLELFSRTNVPGWNSFRIRGEMIKIEIPNHWASRATVAAVTRIDRYAAGKNENSRAVAHRNADKNFDVQFEGILAEIGFCLWRGLDPEAAIDWSYSCRDWDIEWRGLLLDIKSTSFRGDKLIWSLAKNHIFPRKKFHALFLVHVDGEQTTIGIADRCWSSKEHFAQASKIADTLNAPRLDAGTRFMSGVDLWPRSDFDRADLAAIAIRAGELAQYVLHQWPRA